MGQVKMMQDQEILSFLQQKSATARYTTSVCTGSLILAMANLLQGYQATCHWAFREHLAFLGVEVVSQRVVLNRDRLTGAGVTSGIDLALVLVSLLWEKDTAKMAQLIMEYEPQPPFTAGTPETAEQAVVESLKKAGQPLLEAFWTGIKRGKQN
jgi:cyclohexyl-isocyanide hydratase